MVHFSAVPLEVDETYLGGKDGNMSNAERTVLADTDHEAVGKTPLVGEKDRTTNKVAAKVVRSTDKETLQALVNDHTAPEATVHSDDGNAYKSLPFTHAAVKNSLSNFVKADIHTNGTESLWSMLKHAQHSTFHKLSPKHLDRYENALTVRHNNGGFDTIRQMDSIALGSDHKLLRYSRQVV